MFTNQPYKQIKYLLIIFILLHFSSGIKAQLINFDLWKLRKEWGYFDFAKANTARFSMYMTRGQKRTILYMNLARQDGVKFSELVAAPYTEKNPDKSELYISLSQTNLPMLYPSFRLWLSAVPHAVISGIIGMEGHQGFEFRLPLFLNVGETGENCDYGYFKAIDITLALLNSPGHRKNILNEDFSRTAVSKMPHISYRWNSVTTFSGPKFSDMIFRDHCNIKSLQASVSYVTDFSGSGIDFLIGQRKNKDIMSARWGIGSELHFRPTETIFTPKLHWASEFYFFSLGCNFVNYLQNNQWTPVLRPEISFRFPYSIKRNRNRTSISYLDLEESHVSLGISYGYNINLDPSRSIPGNNHIFCVTYSRNFLFKRKDKKKSQSHNLF